MVLTLAVACAATLGRSTTASTQSLALQPIPGAPYDTPTYVTSPPEDSTRLFVVQEHGLIKVIDDGVPQSTPFLNITSLVGQDPELGILSMAFAPDYATSRKFYVYYTASSNRNITIAEFLTDPTNPDHADPATIRVLLSIPHPETNHNGGQLQFGPDGYLYVADGDAGGQQDPYRNGQNLNVLPGKLLRIDPFRGSPYAIPPNNPFAHGTPTTRPEIFSYGFRNPWRFSFDRLTGDLTLGDVGQDTWEEVDYAPLAAAAATARTSGGAATRRPMSTARTASATRCRCRCLRFWSTTTVRAAARSPEVTSRATRSCPRCSGATSSAITARGGSTRRC